MTTRKQTPANLESPATEKKSTSTPEAAPAAALKPRWLARSQAGPAHDGGELDEQTSGLPEALKALAADARVTVLRGGPPDPNGKAVVYWMQRAERGVDNHAVNVAVAVANELNLPLVVYFAGIANFPHANLRHYAFLNQGLPDIEEDLAARNISFVTRYAPREDHLRLFHDVGAAFVIGDENPMRAPRKWREDLAKQLMVPFWTVDADVIVPSKLIEKAQYGAYTIRPRLYRLLPQYLVPYENPHAHHAWKRPKGFHTDDVRADMTQGWKDFDRTVPPVTAWQGGTHAAQRRLKHFVANMLKDYDKARNKPEIDGSSMLSPYLHYGHLGPQTIALAIAEAAAKDPKLQEAKESFFNELIAWRELAVNFVWHTADYDNPACAEDWARKTIAEHARDQREHLYTMQQMERAETHDDLWNAAQLQGVHFGWMHNFLRMYWAKKILEWTPCVNAAMKTAVYLNDRYFLDGRDPGGYAGIAWAILGKFDRAWGSRPIFGKRRFMSGASTGKKFDSRRYIQQMRALQDRARG
jgi:deoxyribodipyrimidine photo-lyase